MQLWTPEREWEGEDAFLIGGGPSLTGFDFSKLEGLNTIGCNDAFHLGPAVIKFCVFGDTAWWHKNKWALEKFAGRVVTSCPGVMGFNIPNLLKMTRQQEGLWRGNVLGWNFSTGACAINLALSLGAARVFLLGYDLNNQRAKSHWHAHNTHPIQEFSFQRFLKGFKIVAECLPVGVKVYNVTDGTSRLRFFPAMSFEEFEAILPKKEALVLK